MSDQDIRAEVDTFMFEVRISFSIDTHPPSSLFYPFRLETCHIHHLLRNETDVVV